jgi:hypothetical protein
MLASNDQGKLDYLRRADAARREAAKAPAGLLREGFLKLAVEWDRLAHTVGTRTVNGSSS